MRSKNMRLNRQIEDVAQLRQEARQAISFDAAFRARLRDLVLWRRDVRRFRRDPLPDGMLESLPLPSA
jgi:putative N-acetylmannosamine-6-phosphate epimerase